LIEAFRMMAEIHRSLWINVVDNDMQFQGIVFRRDFKDILKEWNLHQVHDEIYTVVDDGWIIFGS